MDEFTIRELEKIISAYRNSQGYSPYNTTAQGSTQGTTANFFPQGNELGLENYTPYMEDESGYLPGDGGYQNALQRIFRRNANQPSPTLSANDLDYFESIYGKKEDNSVYTPVEEKDNILKRLFGRKEDTSSITQDTLDPNDPNYLDKLRGGSDLSNENFIIKDGKITYVKPENTVSPHVDEERRNKIDEMLMSYNPYLGNSLQNKLFLTGAAVGERKPLAAVAGGLTSLLAIARQFGSGLGYGNVNRRTTQDYLTRLQMQENAKQSPNYARGYEDGGTINKTKTSSSIKELLSKGTSPKEALSTVLYNDGGTIFDQLSPYSGAAYVSSKDDDAYKYYERKLQAFNYAQDPTNDLDKLDIAPDDYEMNSLGKVLPKYNRPTPTVVSGSDEDYVMRLQNSLNNIQEFSPNLKVDGVLGDKTLSALDSLVSYYEDGGQQQQEEPSEEQAEIVEKLVKISPIFGMSEEELLELSPEEVIQEIERLEESGDKSEEVMLAIQLLSEFNSREEIDYEEEQENFADGGKKASNGDYKKSTREGKKIAVYMDGTWHHFGDSSMSDFRKHKDPKRKKAWYDRHKKALSGTDARAKAFRKYAKITWEDGGEIQ
jgi:hypothetical protein